MIVLEYEDQTLQIRNPTFTTKRWDLKTKFRRTMAGGLRSWKRTSVADVGTFEVLALTREKFEELRTFIRAAHGSRIKMTEATTVPGMVIEPEDIVEVQFIRLTDQSIDVREQHHNRFDATISYEVVT